MKLTWTLAEARAPLAAVSIRSSDLEEPTSSVMSAAAAEAAADESTEVDPTVEALASATSTYASASGNIAAAAAALDGAAATGDASALTQQQQQPPHDSTSSSVDGSGRDGRGGNTSSTPLPLLSGPSSLLQLLSKYDKQSPLQQQVVRRDERVVAALAACRDSGPSTSSGSGEAGALTCGSSSICKDFTIQPMACTIAPNQKVKFVVKFACMQSGLHQLRLVGQQSVVLGGALSLQDEKGKDEARQNEGSKAVDGSSSSNAASGATAVDGTSHSNLAVIGGSSASTATTTNSSGSGNDDRPVKLALWFTGEDDKPVEGLMVGAFHPCAAAPPQPVPELQVDLAAAVASCSLRADPLQLSWNCCSIYAAASHPSYSRWVTLSNRSSCPCSFQVAAEGPFVLEGCKASVPQDPDLYRYGRRRRHANDRVGGKCITRASTRPLLLTCVGLRPSIHSLTHVDS